jgi:signal transduction histidine kinase
LPRAKSTAVALLLLLLGFVAFALTAVASRMSLDQAIRHSAERDHAMETQLLIEELHGLLLDVEGGQRGFILTGQDELLDAYRTALLRLQGVHSRLVAQLSAATGQAVPSAELDALIAQRIEQAQQNLQRRRAEGEPGADLALYAEGKRLMDAIRNQLDRLKVEQAHRVEMQDQAMNAVQRRATGLGIALPLLGSVLIAAAVGRLLYERARRDQAETALRRMNTTLEEQVGQRTGELQRALGQIQSFASELDRSIEAERRRLARELHDQFGQIATAIRMIVLGLRKTEPPADEATVKELVELVDEAIGMARRISAALRPPLLDDLGLAAAVEHFASGIERQSGLKVFCDISDDSVLSAAQANQLFRILQEATTNVLRHARATELHICAIVEEDVYQLDISDNGVGPGSVRADASGLRNMRERAQLIDALMHFGPGATKGTRVSVRVPVSTTEEAT